MKMSVSPLKAVKPFLEDRALVYQRSSVHGEAIAHRPKSLAVGLSHNGIIERVRAACGPEEARSLGIVFPRRNGDTPCGLPQEMP